MGKIIPFPEPPDDRESLSSTEVLTGAAITFRQLDYWTRTGLLVPYNDNPGHGHLRRYSPDQLARAKAVSALLRAGLALPAIRKHITEITTVGALTYGPVTITYTPEEDPA